MKIEAARSSETMIPCYNSARKSVPWKPEILDTLKVSENRVFREMFGSVKDKVGILHLKEFRDSNGSHRFYLK